MGGWLFLISLVIFFFATILLYGLVAYWRRDDVLSSAPLPGSFIISTVCLLLISWLVHRASRGIRRDQFRRVSNLLAASAISAVLFLIVQLLAMNEMLNGPGSFGGSGRGMVGMVVVLAILHALHVVGGVFALGITSLRARAGRYDHERHWPVDFAAHYWHFLDLVWLSMLLAFYFTTGGFDL